MQHSAPNLLEASGRTSSSRSRSIELSWLLPSTTLALFGAASSDTSSAASSSSSSSILMRFFLRFSAAGFSALGFSAAGLPLCTASRSAFAACFASFSCCSSAAPTEKAAIIDDCPDSTLGSLGLALALACADDRFGAGAGSVDAERHRTA